MRRLARPGRREVALALTGPSITAPGSLARVSSERDLRTGTIEPQGTACGSGGLVVVSRPYEPNFVGEDYRLDPVP